MDIPKTHPYYNILIKKEAQQVLDGKYMEWDYNSRKEIEKLEEILFISPLTDTCLVTNDWKPWYRLEDRIKKISEDIEQRLSFELLIADLFLNHSHQKTN